ncbi:MAG: tetratricopeptide repeat protein [Desulfovibrio sp.]|jgi:tol-pal system protein YbgF|nr:tetratricopeptide repeat protein [Desulfovibrio sp.]
MRKPHLIIALCALALAGCAGKMDAQRGLSEEWRLRSLEENFLNFKESQREQEERVREQQRKLMDRVRAMEESLARMQEQMGAAPARSAAPLASAPASSPAPMASAPAPSYVYSSPAPATQAAPASATKSLYEQGMTLVRAEKGAEGRAILTQFLETDPQSALVPNAIYWIGESHYLDKNYAQAILVFKDVTRRFPKHHKAAAALYKIAMCYQAMGEKDNATLYLRALLKDHPKSEPAPAARKMLAELGG